MLVAMGIEFSGKSVLTLEGICCLYFRDEGSKFLRKVNNLPDCRHNISEYNNLSDCRHNISVENKLQIKLKCCNVTPGTYKYKKHIKTLLHDWQKLPSGVINKKYLNKTTKLKLNYMV
jgi:hypothetical protein